MSTSISGIIEYVEEPYTEGGSGYVECFCAFPYLGNDSVLARMLREERGPLPDALSLESIEELAVAVSDELPRGYSTKHMTNSAQAQEWVERGSSSWLRRSSDQQLVEATEPTELVSNPDSFRGAGCFTLEQLEAIQAQYRQENIESEELVAVAPGDPLPERVVGFAGSTADGRTQLYVARQEGHPSILLERVIACMHVATEQGLEPRFICLFR